MYRSSVGTGWSKLLFNIVSIPFVLLLAVLIAKQGLSLHRYFANAEASETGSASFVDETFF